MKPLYFATFCPRLTACMASLALTACTPKIQLETPAEGITINMNVVVDHKIAVEMDEKSRAIIRTTDRSPKATTSPKKK